MVDSLLELPPNTLTLNQLTQLAIVQEQGKGLR